MSVDEGVLCALVHEVLCRVLGVLCMYLCESECTSGLGWRRDTGVRGGQSPISL